MEYEQEEAMEIIVKPDSRPFYSVRAFSALNELVGIPKVVMI